MTTTQAKQAADELIARANAKAREGRQRADRTWWLLEMQRTAEARDTEEFLRAYRECVNA